MALTCQMINCAKKLHRMKASHMRNWLQCWNFLSHQNTPKHSLRLHDPWYSICAYDCRDVVSNTVLEDRGSIVRALVNVRKINNHTGYPLKKAINRYGRWNIKSKLQNIDDTVRYVPDTSPDHLTILRCFPKENEKKKHLIPYSSDLSVRDVIQECFAAFNMTDCILSIGVNFGARLWWYIGPNRYFGWLCVDVWWLLRTFQ